jgi:hypothetical protein
MNLSNQEKHTREANAKNEYLKIFSEEARKEFSFIDSYSYKSQYPILSFVYRQDPKMHGNDYEIIMQKVIISDTTNFKHIALQKKENAQSSGVTAGFESSIKVKYSLQDDSMMRTINIIYDDTLLYKTVSGDNFINYHFQSKNINLYYDQDENVGLGFESDFIDKPNTTFNSVRSTFPFNLSFIKKKNSLFIVAIYPRNNHYKFDSEILRDLFVEKIETNW